MTQEETLFRELRSIALLVGSPRDRKPGDRHAALAGRDSRLLTASRSPQASIRRSAAVLAFVLVGRLRSSRTGLSSHTSDAYLVTHRGYWLAVISGC